MAAARWLRPAGSLKPARHGPHPPGARPNPAQASLPADQPPRSCPDGPAAAHPAGHRSPAPAGHAQRGILRRPVGGPQIMAEQLDQLAEVSGLPSVAAGSPVQHRDASWSDVGPVHHPPVPGQRGRAGKRAGDGLQGRVHRSAVPGQAAGGGTGTRRRSGAIRNLPEKRLARSRTVTEFGGAVAPDPPICTVFLMIILKAAGKREN